ncbi:hypothetical protein LguiA_016823 [Lonicera macranthoides]
MVKPSGPGALSPSQASIAALISFSSNGLSSQPLLSRPIGSQSIPSSPILHLSLLVYNFLK